MNMVDTIIALAFTILMLSVIGGLVHWGSEKNAQQRAARQILEIHNAAEHYARRYSASLLPGLTPTTGTEISVDDLVRDGFLAAAHSGRNVWGQTYKIYFRRLDTTVPESDGAGTTTEHGILVIVITQGGINQSRQFQNQTVPGAVSYTGGQGAYVASGDIPAQPAATLIGSGWSMSLANIGIPNPGGGHLGVISTYSASALSQDFLYRVAVPGHPELNAMQTTLDMSDHAINNISNLQFRPKTMAEMQELCTDADADSSAHVFLLEDNGLYICRDGAVQEMQDTGNALMLKDIQIVSNGDVVVKPNCSPYTNSNAEIYLSPVAMAARTQRTPPITAFQAYATDTGANWEITIRMQDSKSKSSEPEWRYPDAAVAQAQAVIICRSPAMEIN